MELRKILNLFLQISNNKYEIFAFSFLFSLLTCGSLYSTKIVVINNSEYRIDSIKISTKNVNLKFIDIPPGKKVVKTFKIEKNKIEYEGAFLVQIYIRDSLRRAGTFAYYSDSKNIKEGYKLIIYDDFEFKESP